MLDFLWNAHHQGQIGEASADAAAARHDAKTASDHAEELERRVEALTLTCQALWELSSVKLGLTEATLLAKVQEIDLRDGRADGKVAQKAGKCPRCYRATSSTRRRCVYCGAPFVDGPVFRKTH